MGFPPLLLPRELLQGLPISTVDHPNGPQRSASRKITWAGVGPFIRLFAEHDLGVKEVAPGMSGNRACLHAVITKWK
jgi:hypothetical protein